MKSEPVKYKDTLAVPGSELHRLLTEGKTKAAEASYQATEQRHRKLMGLSDERTTETRLSEVRPLAGTDT